MAAMSGHQKPNKGETDTWLTPPYILEALGSFDLDPCPPGGTQGLIIPWEGRVWLNPPYSNNSAFMKRMAEHGNGLALVFARTETKWFQESVFPFAHGILFFKQRLKFHLPDGTPAKGNAGAPSVLIAYSQNDLKYLYQNQQWGKVIPLEEWRLWA